MSDRPYVICLMISSIDGRLHPSCYTASPDGSVEDWNTIYGSLHDKLGVDAWLVGRVTMAEMAKDEPRAVSATGSPERPLHKAAGAAPPFAVAVDPHARLSFAKSDVGGDKAVVLLGQDASDAHLAQLAEAGVSYIVSSSEAFDAAAMLAALKRDFAIERLALEGGGGINGTMMAEGLVDELRVLVVPALDGDDGRQGIVIAPEDGLKGKVTLSFLGADPCAHGAVLLRYKVAAT